jgi:HAD superfamily hydrolase (TIGR01509 family)
MTSSPQVLLFDVMDTLVWDPVWIMADFFDASLEELWAVKHPTAWVDFECGKIDQQTFLDTFFLDGREYDQNGFLQLFAQGYRWLDGVEEILIELKQREVPMYALSNYPVWWKMIEEKLGLSKYLEWNFVSCMTGVRKPDPRAYLGPSESLGIPPESILFIDDRTRNCKAARKTGMDAIRFQWASQLRSDLKIRGLLS